MMSLSAQQGLFAKQQRPAQPRSARRGALRVHAGPGKGGNPEEIYLGKGKKTIDDPAKYPDRDSIGVGGWAGGEVQLKEWAAVPFSPLDPKLRKALNDFSDKPKEVVKTEGGEKLYLGKGRFVVDDPKKYPNRDWIGVGGWAGGELGLKEAEKLSLKEGTRVRIRGEPAAWKKNGLFAGVPSLANAGEIGEVRAFRVNGGTLQVAIQLDGDRAPADPAITEEDTEWKKTIVINASDIEVL